MAEYIIVSEFAKKAGISRQAVHKAKDDGRIKRVKWLGPICLIHTSELKKIKKGGHYGK